ncbi:MAG: hypothetical protein OXG44_15850 [Gammaproteobacteria bacterium]|nr:hypothetical protein [Gammaproteobacteria bacterium]
MSSNRYAVVNGVEIAMLFLDANEGETQQVRFEIDGCESEASHRPTEIGRLHTAFDRLQEAEDIVRYYQSVPWERVS